MPPRRYRTAWKLTEHQHIGENGNKKDNQEANGKFGDTFAHEHIADSEKQDHKNAQPDQRRDIIVGFICRLAFQ